jgi:hypothetical protein
MMPRKVIDLPHEYNLTIEALEGDRVVDRREVHNIFLAAGRTWLKNLVHYTSFSPLTPAEDRRIRYMGVGIGGTAQNALGVVNSSPLSDAYPGTNLQTDTDTEVLALERPVRISGGATAYPGSGSDVWLAQVGAPPDTSDAYSVVFSCLLTPPQVAYGSFLVVPVSEVGLFLHSPSAGYVNVYNNQPIAYDTFPSISLTQAMSGLRFKWALHT